jgi:hypothetical protein
MDAGFNAASGIREPSLQPEITSTTYHIILNLLL